ncbi:MAG TPA: 2Fe-2S iron-sulfur cluster-binding protein [Bacillota bacterium]
MKTTNQSATADHAEARTVRTIKLECFRFDPERDEAPRFQTYEVLLDGEMRVSDCLEYIRENLDPTLAFFVNCKRGTCGRCTMRINGKPQLACLTVVDGDTRVEPVKVGEVIRDLWVKSI